MDYKSPPFILLGEPERSLLGTLRGSLIQEMNARVETNQTVQGLRTTLKVQRPDLLIIDGHMNSDSELRQLIRDVRGGLLGFNPFIPIIALIWKPTAEVLHGMINLGVNSIAAKPVSIQTLNTHIKGIMYNMKPFVVVSRYIGPDRRSDLNRPSTVPLIEPPNMLRQKLEGKPPPEVIEQLLGEATRQLNDMRLQRNSQHMVFSLLYLKASIQGGDRARVDQVLKDIFKVIRDFAARLEHQTNDRVLVCCEQILSYGKKLKESPDNINMSDIEAMEKAAYALALELNPGSSHEVIAKEAQESFSAFLSRTRPENLSPPPPA